MVAIGNALACMTVPKTTVNKDGNFLPLEHKIRSAHYRVVAPPTVNTFFSEQRGKFFFGAFVSFGLYR